MAPPYPTRRIAYLDCSSGVSGDKFLAACLDAGADAEAVRASVDALGVGARLECADVRRWGLRGLSVVVRAPDSPPARAWQDVRVLIEQAELDAAVTDGALRAFRLLAEAEARVHGVAPETVHFHEVGAVDAIADIVGSVAAFASLRAEWLVCSPVALGGGSVEVAHGRLPVPAPATLELLRDVPVFAGEGEGELTTPTGAAIVRALACEFGGLPAMTPTAIGYGAGSRETTAPNIARMILGEKAPDAERGDGLPGAPKQDAPVRLSTEEATLLVTNIDHITPEHAAFACEELLAEGALDVWQTPAVMKKGRLGFELRALASPDDSSRLASRIADLTGTLGVRVEPLPRFVAERRTVEADTSLGRVHAKVGAGEATTVRIEHEDVARLARETSRRYDEVARTLAEEVRRALDDGLAAYDD